MAIERVVRDNFDLNPRPPQRVKGLDEDVVYYRVAAERDTAGKVRGPLVRQEQELAHLESRWAQVSTGTSTSSGLILCGEGGIGKSRLAGAALDIAKNSGAVVLELFGDPSHTDIGLRPVRRLLERRCGIQRDSDPSESLQLLEAEIENRSLDVAHTAPLLAAVLGIDPGTRIRPPPRAPVSASTRSPRSRNTCGPASAPAPRCCCSKTSTGTTRTPSSWSTRSWATTIKACW